MDAEGRREYRVRGVAAASHENAANARDIVARVKSVPYPAQVRLESRTKIHRGRRGRHTDVAEIAGAVAGRDVHAAAPETFGIGTALVNNPQVL